MSDPGEATPRRALPPRDDSASDEPTSGRLWEHTGPEAPPTTGPVPIPPPAVLPPTGPAPAGVGRRFSAVERADDGDRPLPRRSALSPSSARPVSPRTPSSPDPAPRRRRRWPLLVAAAVLGVAGLLAALWFLRPVIAGPTPSPTPTVDPVATYLLQDADLADLREGTTWAVASTATDVVEETPRPRCLRSAASTTPTPQSSLVRTFAPAGGEAAGVLHQVDAYASPEEAAAAYQQRVDQLGTCEDTTALLVDGVSVGGLGDEASAVTYTFQAESDEHHTLLVSRTGTRVNIVDATQPDAAVQVAPLAAVLAKAAERQCGEAGTCPGEITATVTTPPVTDPPGWLAPVDLPRLTAGVGTWRGTDMPSMRLVGTRCEAVDLAAIPGVTEAEQRTYLLGDDPGVPVGFGLDEAVYTFATADEAGATFAALVANVDGCPGRVPTAQVARVGDLGPAAAAWVVTQQTDASAATARFRLSVLHVEDQLVYLMANPSGEVDFTDEAWIALTQRAAARATQLP